MGEALPNFAIPEVEVDFKFDVANTVPPAAPAVGSKKKPQITIKFTDGHNTGKQHLLVAKSQATCLSGGQPVFLSVNAGGDFVCTVERLHKTRKASDYKESATCSNRGICDQSTGRCSCFDGFFGLACDHVNTYF